MSSSNRTNHARAERSEAKRSATERPEAERSEAERSEAEGSAAGRSEAKPQGRATGPRGLALAAAVLVALVLVVLGLSARRPPWGHITSTWRGWVIPTPSSDATRPSASGTPTPSPATPPPVGTGSSIAGLIVLVLAVLAALVLLVVVVLLVRRVRRLLPERAEDAETDDLDPEFTLAAARRGVERARTRVDEHAEAGDAIIAAWLALERIIDEAGIDRAPSETTLEFVARVLTALDLDSARISELAALYRRALFDAHRPGERERTRARELLDALAAQIDAAR